MKKINFFLIIAVVFLTGMLAISGCRKDTAFTNTMPPVITLNGSETVYHILNTEYKDAGATAKDSKDGNISSSVVVTNPVNQDRVGIYEVVYKVSDTEKNSQTAIRTVIVYNEASRLLSGVYLSDGINYQVHDSSEVNAISDYTQIITPSPISNKKVLFNKFGNYDNNSGIYANINATTITLPLQDGDKIGVPNADHTFFGSGILTDFNFVLKYTDKINSSATKHVATFIKI